VICGDPIRDPASPTHVINPSVLVEVLSPSTMAYDRGEKREHYQRIATLREYMLVAQDRREIEVHHRAEAGAWQRRVHGRGQTVELASIEVRFAVDELYEAAGVG
jgi:Uma2 family endonuclease